MRTIIVGLAASCLIAVSASSTSAGTAKSMQLPDCAGRLGERPTSVILTCADAGVTATKLTWTGWGSPFSAGVGVASVNDCDPSCAEGHFHDFKIVLIAEGRQSCSGSEAYAKVTYAFIGPSPFPQDAPGTLDPNVSYPCART